MTLGFAIRDLVRPRARRISGFGIREGFTVIDFGCGPGGYLKQASELAEEEGGHMPSMSAGSQSRP